MSVSAAGSGVAVAIVALPAALPAASVDGWLKALQWLWLLLE